MMWQLVIILTFTAPLELKISYHKYKNEVVCRTVAAHYRQAKFEQTIANVYASCHWVKNG
jgi:hypothetical protein